MGFFKKKGGFSDVIRCDEKDYLVWKWHPTGREQGKSKRETAIRTNFVLRVKTGEVAVFVYNQKPGVNIDYIVGPYDDILETKNFPVLSSILGMFYEGDTPFQAEVFFINLGKANQIKFGVPYFDVVDPRFIDFQVPVAARGTITFQIYDYKKFINVHQLINFNFEELKTKINSAVARIVKDVIANAPAENSIPLIAIESKIDLINEKVELLVKDRLAELFGVAITGVDLDAIEVDKGHKDYIELKRITKDITTGKAESELLDYQERLRIEREEAQYSKRMGTRQSNIEAYQTEVGGEVGVAGAEALGKMGEKGAGNIDLGGQGTGLNPTTIVAGMAVGSAIGQNIAGTINKAIVPNEKSTSTPPPIPVTKYFVAQGDKPTGPFDIETIRTMIGAGTFAADSVVWKEGMTEWQLASQQVDLAKLFPPKL